MIFVSGWYGNMNIGDELIGVSVAKLLNSYLGNCRIYLSSYNPSYSDKILKEFNFNDVYSTYRLPLSIKGMIRSIIDYRFYFSLFKLLQSDVFVLGGGGFLSDWGGNSTTGWLKLITLAKALKKKTIIFFIGAGPFLHQKSKTKIRHVFNDFTDLIIVRDEESKAYLMECGVLPEKINVSVDPVFILDNMPVNQHPVETRDLKIGVNFINFFSGNPGKKKAYLDSLRHSIRALAKHGSVHLFAMDRTDLVFMREQFANLDLHYSENPIRLFKELSKMDICVGERLHFLISGLLLKKPIVPIIYNHKSFSICKKYGYERYMVDIGDGSQWRDHIFTADELELQLKAVISDRIQIQNNIEECNKKMSHELALAMRKVKAITA